MAILGGLMDEWILTYTHKKFHVLNPKPEDIDIRDIARALSMTCRFSGHVNSFWSVASHSILVSELVSQEHALTALLHDAAEAYLTDIPTPIKRSMGMAKEYREMEDRVLSVIMQKYGGCYPLPDEVEFVDHNIVGSEAIELFNEFPDWVVERKLHLFDVPIKPVGPEEAEKMFLKRFEELT
jgi:hypothetical protein